MKTEETMIGGRRCVVYGHERVDVVAIVLMGAERMTTAEEVYEQATVDDCGMSMVAVPIADWEYELMPWAEVAVSRRAEVGSGAEATLLWLTATAMPWLRQRFGERPVVLAGYSLAGLFSLWAAMQTDAFSAVAAMSPSLWVGGWSEYAERHATMASRVYLSLGEREELTRNATMARVGDRMRAEHARLVDGLGEDNTTLVWEQGGHFNDPSGRMARGLRWCLRQMTVETVK